MSDDDEKPYTGQFSQQPRPSDTRPEAKAKAAVEAILIRRIMERKVQGYTHEITAEIVAAVIEKLDWSEADQRARDRENDCDGT